MSSTAVPSCHRRVSPIDLIALGEAMQRLTHQNAARLFAKWPIHSYVHTWRSNNWSRLSSCRIGNCHRQSPSLDCRGDTYQEASDRNGKSKSEADNHPLG